jgi:hypothetical protein
MVRNLKTSFFDAMAEHDVVAREGSAFGGAEGRSLPQSGG